MVRARPKLEFKCRAASHEFNSAREYIHVYMQHRADNSALWSLCFLSSVPELIGIIPRQSPRDSLRNVVVC